jgi:hypothetical protein
MCNLRCNDAVDVGYDRAHATDLTHGRIEWSCVVGEQTARAAPPILGCRQLPSGIAPASGEISHEEAASIVENAQKRG